MAGFATALDLFPALMALDDPALSSRWRCCTCTSTPTTCEDADALLEVIETLEPPADLAEAVQDIVRALMLIADVTRPRRRPAAGLRPRRHRR